MGVVLPVPGPIAGVIDEKAPGLPVGHADVVAHAVGARRGILPPDIGAQGIGDQGGDAAGIGADPHPAEIIEGLPRNGQAPVTAGPDPQPGRGGPLIVGGLVPVDLVDRLLLEEDGVAQIADAAGELPGVQGLALPAVGGQALEHLEVEGVPQLAGIDRIPPAAPEPVLVDAEIVQVRHRPGNGDRAFFAVHRLRGEGQFRAAAALLHGDDGAAAADTGGEDFPVPAEAVPRAQSRGQGELQGGVLRLEVIGPGLRPLLGAVDPALIQGEGVLVEMQLVPLHLPEDQGLVVLRVALTAGEGQGVPGPKGPGRARRGDGVGPGAHAGVGPAAEGGFAAPALLHAAEVVPGGVVIFLVREDEDEAAHGGEDLFPRRHGPLPHPVVVKARPVGPPDRVSGADAAGRFQRPQEAPGLPGRQQGEFPPGQVLHPPQFPVPGPQVVVQPAEGRLDRRAHDVPGGHFR